MDQKTQLAFISKINENAISLIKSKGHDYSNGGDVLKNFKEVNSIIKILNIDTTKIEGTHIFYIILKIQRLCNLLFSDKYAKNESIQDTLVDLRNYVDLLNCCLEEDRHNDHGTISTTIN
jgi:hypothetical protein